MGPKLAWLIRREGVAVSTSTIGRILTSLMQRGLFVPVPTLRRKPKQPKSRSRRPRRVRRPQWSPALVQAVEELRGEQPDVGKPGGRRFRVVGKRYARRLPKGLKPKWPGQIVRIDTVFVNLAPGKAIKHFTAYHPVAKWTVAGIAGRATADLAARFLDKVLRQMPFKVTGIQVDGGSEFIASFEQACRPTSSTSSCAAKAAPAQRSRRTLQRSMAIRVLCRP
ncbi:hypothetical protein NKJ28_31065 [Mesorhizobium sp. M0145]|uniref:hypothetical protein n=1 Tax=Mesorhizobium sp. M0145 TaxID=2956895 RepID=UPI003338A923